MAINYAKLVKLYQQVEVNEATRAVRASFLAKELSAKEFDLGKLFTECFGWPAFVAGRNGELAHRIWESTGAVASSAFQNISGQIVYNAIMEKYEDEDFVFTKLIPEQQTNFNGEKIAGISRIGDEAMIRNETDPYALAGVREDWIETPETKDRGFIVPVTREAIFFDRTGVLLERCGEVGYWLGVNVEKRAIDSFIDENTTDHRYKWRGTIIATYGDNSGTHTWDNLAASNALVDWTDADVAEQVFNGLVDPSTNEPINIEAKHLVATKQLEQTARRLLSATEIRVATPGYATTGNPTQTNMANPYANKYQLVTSKLLATRMATDTDWFVGDVSKVSKRMVNWPLSTVQAPPNSHDEFHRQIVQQFRVNERSAFVVVEPRAAVKNTA